MGSTFEYVTIAEAAKLLDVSERSVYNFIYQARLRTTRVDRKQLVLKQDIENLRELRGKKKLPYPVDPKTLALMDSRIQQLEKYMKAAMKILDMHLPLGLPVEELDNLLAMAVHEVENGWAPQTEEMWVGTFLRMSVEDLEMLEAYLGCEHPWRPFYQLCKAMYQTPYDNDRKLQFLAAQQNLEKIAHIYISTRGETPKVFMRIDKKDDKAVRRIVRMMENKKAKNSTVH